MEIPKEKSLMVDLVGDNSKESTAGDEDLTKVGMDETALNEERPPPAAVTEALKRRSSVGHSIRRSQSGANGLTFEDQLLVIADNTADVSVKEKVRKVVNLAISATCRALLNENDKLIDLEPGSSDEKRAELVDTLASALGQRPLMQETHLSEVGSFIGKMAGAKSATAAGIKAPTLMSSRLSQLKNYVSALNEERDSWSALKQSRKNKFNLVRAERQAIIRGEKCVTSAERENLSPYEDAWLKNFSDGSGELDRMKKQAIDVENARNALCDKVKRKRKILDDMNNELDDMIHRIEEASKRTIVGGGAGGGLESLPPIRKAESIPDTPFGAEVKAWIADMQD